MKLNIQLKEEDYVKATILGLRTNRRVKITGLVIIIATVYLVITSILESPLTENTQTYDWIAAGLIAWMIFLFGYLLPRRLRKIFRQQKSMHSPRSVEITDAGVAYTMVEGETKNSWDYFVRWSESKTLFVLFQSEAMMNMIPKRCFASAEEMAEFRELLTRKIGPARK